MLLTNAAGEERWIETTYSSIRDDAGAVTYVVAVLRDIHERKLLEERLHQTEKLASLGQLVAGIAHEIKNPLAIILSSLDVIQSPRHSPDQQREAAGFIREEIRRIDDRLRAFLAFARPRAIEPRPFDLPALLQRRVERIAGLFPAVAITIDTAPNAATMRGDEEQLDQVLTNLLMNAGEAAGGSGAILLRTRRLGDTILLDIEDSGPGVPEEFHARVFDPFFTTKSDGTGLGLSICYQIILAHGGTISVGRARTLSGACFSVRIPLAEGRAAVPAAP
jgi:signal transduction histidine kinase